MTPRPLRQTIPPADEQRMTDAQQRLDDAWNGATAVGVEVRRLTELLEAVPDVDLEPLDETEQMVATLRAGLACVSDAGMRRGA